VTKEASRVASYAIQGFIYQFVKTLLAILESNDEAKIMVEGVIEDIDIAEPFTMTAIQCKYHEAKSYSLSSIYKPLLQMMEHFHKNPKANIHYKLFAYFSNLTICPPITETEINQILNTQTPKLKKMADKLRGKVEVQCFLARFSFEIGPSLSELKDQVTTKFQSLGFLQEDVPYFLYPNAVDHIAQLSLKQSSEARTITRQALVSLLKEIKTTTVSRWTLALTDQKKLLAFQKNQIKHNLAKNVRRRSFIISPKCDPNFMESIVIFISEFVEKYHCKKLHTETPLFCLDCDKATFDEIQKRLYIKGVTCNDGYVGSSYFSLDRFARNPLVISSQREFVIRLLRYGADPNALNVIGCDDLFILSDTSYPPLATPDYLTVNLSVENLGQAKFVLGVSNA